MLVSAGLQRRRQPLLWPMNADPPPPPWVWMVPGSAGLLRLGAGVAPQPLLLATAQPPAAPLLRGPPGWQAPGEPLPPLLPLPSAPDHAAAAAHHLPLLHGQWLFGGPALSVGLSPASAAELVPLFPHACLAALPPAVGKSWPHKRMPSCKVLVDNALALDSAWVCPEDSRMFHVYEKPPFLASPVALPLSGPAPARRPLPAVVLAPQPLPGGCHNSLKPVGTSPAIAIAAAAAAMVSVDPEGRGGPSPSHEHPCHFLTLAPIRIPLRTTPFSERGRAGARTPCPPGLLLPADRKSPARGEGHKEAPAILVAGQDGAARGSRPVASAPVPGSPWCVVWTGDDRVFFFNPTMQLSVWERPLDLRHRGDLNRILRDPPHKRKRDAAAADPSDHSDGSGSEDGSEDSDRENQEEPAPPLPGGRRHLLASDPHDCGARGAGLSSPPVSDEETATAANATIAVQCGRMKTTPVALVRTEGHTSPGPEDAERKDRGPRTPPPPQILPPLEERVTHFRDMLLERGVSAFSTWEKELHKIVFDPRYLLLNSEERKQIFEQFVKTRIKEEYKEKKSKLLLAKEEFKKLLEESKVSPRTTFKEFAEKHGRDQRFRLVPKRKDQEHFFNQFVLTLKRRDKENRLRLRKMR